VSLDNGYRERDASEVQADNPPGAIAVEEVDSDRDERECGSFGAVERKRDGNERSGHNDDCVKRASY
jgi:hypothetical protein